MWWHICFLTRDIAEVGDGGQYVTVGNRSFSSLCDFRNEGLNPVLHCLWALILFILAGHAG